MKKLSLKKSQSVALPLSLAEEDTEMNEDLLLPIALPLLEKQETFGLNVEYRD